MGLIDQGAKPTGSIGRFIGKMMNQFHTKTYIKYFQDKFPADQAQILDIGCGGGKFLKFLSQSNPSYKLIGIDHSSEMVRLSKKVNRKAIERNRMKIIQASVENLSFDKESFDLITAFETIQFWQDHIKSFSEIRDLLKENASFLIVNLYPKEGSKWFDHVKIKSDKEYIDTLQKAGFKEVSIDLDFKKGWIIVEAIK